MPQLPISISNLACIGLNTEITLSPPFRRATSRFLRASAFGLSERTLLFSIAWRLNNTVFDAHLEQNGRLYKLPETGGLQAPGLSLLRDGAGKLREHPPVAVHARESAWE